MISFVRGRVVARGAGWAEIDVAGFGLRLLMPEPAVQSLPSPGTEATIPTHLVLREDGVELLGFRDLAEREAFTALQGVAGIGPRTALALLSHFTPQALAQAVEGEDVTALTRVPGIGRKTAQRLILERKGKLPSGDGRPAAPPPESGAHADARAALVALGYTPEDAAAALAALAEPSSDTAELVRAALRQLSRRL